MNLLPFVLIILALFATLSTSLLTKGRSLALKQKAYQSYMTAERSAKNATIKAAYDKIPLPKTDKEPKKTPTPKHVKNWRQQLGKQKKARLNIYALLHEQDPPAHLTHTFFALIDELYSNLPLYIEVKKEGKLPAFFDEWKNHDQLSEITYEDESLALLMYKMIKGCVCYDTEEHTGYPPLDDFVHIERSNAGRPMPWRLARPPLLRAYFGQVATSILTLEAENPTTQSTLTRDQLEELLQTHPNIPKHLLCDAVGNTSDVIVVGENDLTQVRHH